MAIFINRQQFPLSDRNFFPVESEKTGIVLHYTAGKDAYGAFASWKNRTDRVATSYIIGADSKIFECFNPLFWGYHLGLKSPHWENGKHDKRTIGVEICNVGPLIKKADGWLYYWPKNYGLKYCHSDEREKYICADWRGMSYHATFSEEQIVSTVELVRDLCSQFNIPPDLSTKKMDYDIEFFKKWTGISCHHNWRSDKFDTGPAFPLNRLKF